MDTKLDYYNTLMRIEKALWASYSQGLSPEWRDAVLYLADAVYYETNRVFRSI